MLLDEDLKLNGALDEFTRAHGIARRLTDDEFLGARSFGREVAHIAMDQHRPRATLAADTSGNREAERRHRISHVKTVPAAPDRSQRTHHFPEI